MSPDSSRRADDAPIERQLAEERARLAAAVDALSDSEARFRGAFEHAAIGMAISDPQGIWIRVNRALCQIVGYAEAELLGRSFQEITHPDDLARDVEILGGVLAGEIDDCQLEKRLVHKRGHAVWVMLNAVAVRDANRVPLYYVLQYQDISERRRTEAALRLSEARYERVASHAPGMVYQYVFRPDGTAGYTFVGEGARTLFGVAPEEALRDPRALLDLVHPAEWPHFHELALESASQLVPFLWEGRVVLRSGEERIIQVAARDERMPDGSTVSDGIVIDVTELRLATRRLEESEQRYRSLFEKHPDAVYSLDRAGRLISLNPACEVLSGWSIEELIGRSFRPLLAPEQTAAVTAHFEAALAGAAQRFEASIRHRSGRLVDIDVTNIPVVVGGEVVGVFGIARDLTARRALEAQLQQAQKMEAIGRLAGGVAHDFNNILAAIAGFAELLHADTPADDPRHEDVVEILKGTSRAAALTKQLLAFSRRQVLQPTTLDLNEIVAETATMLRPLLGAGNPVVTRLAPSAAPVFADRTQLEQVLVNLALNARDAMPDGGTITIEVATGRAADGAPCARLAVADTGVGIPPEVQARIFEPFYTTKPTGKGTGLGLAMVHGIVQQSGGTIAMESQAGEGTVFTVTLPLVATVLPAASPTPAAVPEARGAGSVLVVEDEEAVRVIAQRVLERAGYHVLVAHHGAEALDVLASADAEVDVLLSDIVMPEMGGPELAARALERVPGLRVVLMSGYTDADVSVGDAERRIDAFVQKPFTAESLVDAVRSAMRARAA